MKRLNLIAFAAVALAAAWWLIDSAQQVSAQSGTRRTRVADSRPFEERLWSYLVQQKYTNWAPVPGKSDDYAEGQSPHGAFVKMYLNRKAAGNAKSLPSGSVIVKENYGPDKKTLMAVTVMYKSKGYNPDGGDWYWAKYNPNGTIAKMPPDKGSMKIAGRAKGCIMCHTSGAEGNDLAFFNDGR